MKPHKDVVQLPPEFSRITLISDLTPHPTTFSIEAKKEECEALAQRFGLVSVNFLKAQYEIWRKADTETICLKGLLKAEVIQNCVITFAPVTEEIKAEFKEFFQQNETLSPEIEDELEFDLSMLEDEDYPELISGNELDVGEIVAQHLSLSLNPYPKAKGADLSKIISNGDEEKQNPFADLSKKLEQKEKKGS